MRRPRLAAAGLALAVAAAGGLASAARGDAPERVSRYVTDDRGRVLTLHGFNTASSAKSTPDALPELTEADVETEYRAMGTNFVRFLMQWRAVEPSPGVYDTKYLEKVAERVGWYAKRGYHVMLDMHQDLWGNQITPDGRAGNGAPGWATHLDGLPVAGEHDTWELYYLDPGVMRAFDHFWNTTGEHPELMDHYARAWRAVADHFKDDPAVIGYDLMNEPWGGSVQGAAFENGPLAELYRRTIAQIRSVDQDNWIFVEPQAVGVNWGLPSGLPRFDDPRAGEPGSAWPRTSTRSRWTSARTTWARRASGPTPRSAGGARTCSAWPSVRADRSSSASSASTPPGRAPPSWWNGCWR